MAESNSLASWIDTLSSTCHILEKAKEKGMPEKVLHYYDVIDKFMWEVLEPGNAEIMINETLNRKMINACRALITGGGSIEEFSSKVREYDDAPACALVWTPNFVAYRCRTCGLTPCMSLCSDCFLAGNHEGHDYNMFRSQAGGACDCGDVTVMKESGFCPKHSEARKQRKTPPAGLLTVAQYILPHIYCRLIFHFRENTAPTSFVEGGNLVTFLQGLSDLGAAMKNVMCSSIMDEESYSRLTKVVRQTGVHAAYISRSSSLYASILESSVDCITTQDDADALDCPELCSPLEHRCFADELMFWLVKFEFPQKLITLLLSLLSNEEYKNRFAVAFVKHYSRIATLLSTSRATEIANRVIHMSVQLMSSESLAMKLNKEQKLLRILVVSLHNMIKKGLTECVLHTTTRNFHRVADCSSPIMENHNYWALASDLHNVLGNKAVARAFLRDPALVDLWCNFIAFFQGMNVNTRQLEQHLEYESRAYYPAFTAEVEVCSSIMWCLVNQLKDERLFDCILYTVQYVLGQIQEWFENIHFVPESCWKPSRLSVTFHLPLHRLYAGFVCESIKLGMQVRFPSETFLRQLVMHPLQIQVTRAEISAGMWVRNGQSIRYQSCLYVQSHFCASFLDLDLYLLQVCGARVHPDWFVLTIFERFHMVEWLSFSPAYPTRRFLRPEWEMPLLEGALRLIATLICNTLSLGMSEEDVMKREIATLLATGNKTHSQILEQLPDTGNAGQPLKLVEKILEELAVYHPPQFEPGGSMRQGTYMPKDEVWLRYFDPLFIMLRTMQVKDYQDAFMRYTDFVRKKGLYKQKGPPWPPMRIPSQALPAYDTLRRILHCRSLHAILYVILFKAVADLCPVPEQVLHLILYLLELAMQLPVPGAAVTEAVSKRHTVLNLQFCGWFPGNCLFTNLCHHVDRILNIDNMPGLSRSCQDDTDTDADFPDLIRLRAKLSGSTLATTPDNQMVPSHLPQTRSEHIPFIDSIETDVEVDTDYFYNKAMACLPDALRRQYLTSSPARLALTLDGEASATVQEAIEDMAVAVESTEEPSVMTGGSDDEVEQEMHSSEGPSEETAGSEQNGERALVLKQPRAVVHVRLRRRHPTNETPCSLPSAEGYLSLPSSARPPHSLPQPKVHVVNTGESLVTLLIKLHNKLAGEGRVYQPPDTERFYDPGLVGDGPCYISNLLDRIYYLTPACRRDIDALCQAFASPRKFGGPNSDDPLHAKKKAAKERQQRLMAQFTSRQKAVMDQLMQQESSSASGSYDAGEDEHEASETVACVICNQTSTSLMRRPIGLVTLATATSVFGKAYPEAVPFIPSVFEVTDSHKVVSRGQQETRYYRSLMTSFNRLSCISSTSVGWEGGVHLSTCGHFVHIDCQEAYVKAIWSDASQPDAGSVLARDKGEFFCPLCRQLANCVLPSVPVDQPAASTTQRDEAKSADSYFERLSTEVMEQLESGATISLDSPIGVACDRFITRLMEATYPRFNEFVSEMNAVWAFLFGVLRTNLEAQCCSNVIQTMQKRSCLRYLLNLMPSQIAGSKADDVHQCCVEWSALCNVRPAGHLDSLPLANVETEVPMVLKDASTVLIRMAVIMMRRARSPEHFAVVCRALYNLVAFQSIVNVIEQSSVRVVPPTFVEKARRDAHSEVVVTSGNVGMLTAFILEKCYGDAIRGYEVSEQTMNEDDFCFAVESRCVPFLRVAALLKHYALAGPNLPSLTCNSKSDLSVLRNYVFGQFGIQGPALSTAVLGNWVEELKRLKAMDSLWHPVLGRPFLWATPRLLSLPKQFDLLFQRYHKAKCSRCGTAPKETLLCLVCGDVVCYRDNCCMSNSLTELETHTVDCGAGVGVFVSVQTSTIIVTRDKKAAHWGSLYLDAHGEEDRGLKRGKPLSLSEERFNMLERNWLSHTFDSVCKRWFWIGQSWTNIVIPL